ncbi:MAG: BON domain-containing protein [Betaproteobacteria bacterium]|nr:BON domain-containing protein [Betaproteobacteria bacterium]
MILLGKITRFFLLLALVASIASCATKPPRNSSEIKADKAIELAVTQQLDDDQNIYARHIEVDVYRGVVTLSGFVFEANDLFEAAQVAARVPGVISVSNQMQLEVFGRGGRR